eukprot:scaffold133444_cov75-Phaeocystis_antarctica.AAC.2
MHVFLSRCALPGQSGRGRGDRQTDRQTDADRQTDRQTDRQFGRKTHSEQLGCCATHLWRHNSAPWRHHTRPAQRGPTGAGAKFYPFI